MQQARQLAMAGPQVQGLVLKGRVGPEQPGRESGLQGKHAKSGSAAGICQRLSQTWRCDPDRAAVAATSSVPTSAERGADMPSSTERTAPRSGERQGLLFNCAAPAQPMNLCWGTGIWRHSAPYGAPAYRNVLVARSRGHGGWLFEYFPNDSSIVLPTEPDPMAGRLSGLVSALAILRPYLCDAHRIEFMTSSHTA